ncbi:MAG: hypothetical protein M3209_09655 [Acidobacteriota bacterium]|nr:hypothetical protein [Acidobacteriota bacterium]
MALPLISKHTVECYKIRHLQNGGWADITIDANGEKGRIQIASDYGDWQHHWIACGMPFKQFLTQLGIDYVADKFRANEWFDSEGTVQLYRECVCERRRCEGTSKETARAVWNEIKALEGLDKQSFRDELSHSSAILRFFDNCPPTETSIDPLFKRFWQECWLPFMEELKAEVARTLPHKNSQIHRI